ncbi:MAG TPA: hypothetical protein VK050_03305 [Flavobacteriaceae bacterium]|nr:hypothetical protein [Flavobacteriaceae bacterium]
MLRYFLILFPLISFLGFISCASETESGDIIFENNPLKDRQLIYSFSNEVHEIELYSRDSVLYEGFNDILIKIKDKNDKYISYADIQWQAVANDSSIAPITEIVQSTDNPDVYNSFLIFPKNAFSKDWTLNVTYQIQSTTYESNTNLSLFNPDENRITIEERFGSNGKEYLITLTNPYKPINGFNNCSLMLYKKQGSNYHIVKDLTILVWCSKDDYVHDEVVDLPFQSYSNRYENRIEIIDLGIWQLNVVVKDKNGDIILGEEKSANQLISSLHFPLVTNQ